MRIKKTHSVDRLMRRFGDSTISELDSVNSEEIPNYPDELSKILEYLPEKFSDETEKKYIDALMLAAQTSFKNGLYQFAYIQYHMLFMTAVYYVILKVSIFHEEDLKKALYYLLKDRYADFWKETNTKSGKLYFGSFAVINESDVFMLLHVVGLDSCLLGELQKLVQKRNKYAHANGQLLLTSDELFMDELNNYNAKIQRIVDLLKNDLITFYKKTISDPEFYNPDIRAYLDPDDQIIQEFIKEYSVSRVELNWLRKIRLIDFDSYEGKDEIKTLHCALIHYYRTLAQDGYQPFEDPYVLRKYKTNAAEFVERLLNISSYECGKEGGEFPVYECLECGEDQLVHDAEKGTYHCFACDENYTEEDLTFCENCGSIMWRNDEPDICCVCLENIMNE